jgi:hypothetical protein
VVQVARVLLALSLPGGTANVKGVVAGSPLSTDNGLS